MSGLKVAGWILFIVGGCLIWFGVQEFQLGSDASAEAIETDLAALEAGEPLPDAHVKIGLHHCMYNSSVFEFEDADGSGRMKPSSELTWLYSPLISDTNPYMAGLRALEKKYGSLQDVPRGATWPKLEHFVVLLKSSAYATVGDVPSGRKKYASVEGLVINRIESLTDEQEQLIHARFPGLDLDKTWIVEHGREPTSAAASIAFIGVGVLLVLMCVALAFRRKRAGTSLAPETPGPAVATGH